MLVLKLAYMGELDFIKELQELKTLLKNKDIVIGLVEKIEGKIHIVKVMCDEECYSDKIFEKIKIYISEILYKIVIKNYKEKELFEFLTDTYFFLKQDEIIEIEKSIMDTFYKKLSIKDEVSVYCENKINKITSNIKECLDENNEFNINGFITFRMKELKGDIERVIDKVIEKYMVEKEYREFIKLLKYFVDIQESKLERVDIIINKDGGYSVVDQNNIDLFDEFMKELSDCKLGVDANVEDVIISGLITNAPKKINIFKKKYCTNKEFIDTIVNVFEKRVEFINECDKNLL
ncbi:putative sporulation protein YtxC [Eubacterium multiforme]|uniref:Sporulation protein YtxC n=1 Tax=Eubacterium multiforme TaxID=83339 RepID=A0ABT9UVX1_9FIRM|nr:putative sporulation protein YtxC [Eubacterium multiforme]MDQ0150470.1 putative sporulation protein YtxC [Eubacterium multiforme]